MTASFTDVRAGERNAVVVSARNLSVKRSTGSSPTTTVKYVGQDVSTTGGVALAAQLGVGVEQIAF